MALTTTTNYSLRKHDAGDLNWDVDLNYNMDIIDIKIKDRDTDLNVTHAGKQLDPTSADVHKTKHLSNIQAKKWEDHVNNVIDNPHNTSYLDVNALPILSGDTASRPVAPTVQTGWIYFDTTIGKPVWYDGSGWVDATGTTA